MEKSSEGHVDRANLYEGKTCQLTKKQFKVLFALEEDSYSSLILRVSESLSLEVFTCQFRHHRG